MLFSERLVHSRLCATLGHCNQITVLQASLAEADLEKVSLFVTILPDLWHNSKYFTG